MSKFLFLLLFFFPAFSYSQFSLNSLNMLCDGNRFRVHRILEGNYWLDGDANNAESQFKIYCNNKLYSAEYGRYYKKVASKFPAKVDLVGYYPKGGAAFYATGVKKYYSEVLNDLDSMSNQKYIKSLSMEQLEEILDPSKLHGIFEFDENNHSTLGVGIKQAYIDLERKYIYLIMNEVKNKATIYTFFVFDKKCFKA